MIPKAAQIFVPALPLSMKQEEKEVLTSTSDKCGLFRSLREAMNPSKFGPSHFQQFVFTLAPHALLMAWGFYDYEEPFIPGFFHERPKLNDAAPNGPWRLPCKATGFRFPFSRSFLSGQFLLADPGVQVTGLGVHFK